MAGSRYNKIVQESPPEGARFTTDKDASVAGSVSPEGPKNISCLAHWDTTSEICRRSIIKFI